MRLRLLLLLPLAVSLASQVFAQEVVSQVQVHGNTLTSDDEILKLSGVTVGMTVDDQTIATATARLQTSNRFEQVNVLKRFASITDPTQVILVIVVDEGPVRIEVTRAAEDAGEGEDGKTIARAAKARGLLLMFLPILNFEDGYGFSYGARFSVPNPAGSRSRLSFPATWGGEKLAAVEFDKTFSRGPVTRLASGASVTRRTNPFYEEDDDRRRAWIRLERELAPPLRIGATGALERAAFGSRHDQFTAAGIDLTFDTRLDPVLPRNAVYARAAWEHLNFDGADSINQTEFDGRGYLGLMGQTVLMLRAYRSDADQFLPPYLQPMLGGMPNVRGFPVGSDVGDTLVGGTGELRIPLTSPLSVGKLGVSVFVDAGTVYGKNDRLRDQPFERGVGGSVWFSAAVIRLNLSAAHGIGAGTRVHFGTTASF